MNLRKGFRGDWIYVERAGVGMRGDTRWGIVVVNIGTGCSRLG